MLSNLFNQLSYPIPSIIIHIALLVYPFPTIFLLYKHASRKNMFSRTYRNTSPPKLTSPFSVLDFITSLAPLYAITLMLAFLFAFTLLYCYVSSPGGSIYFEDTAIAYIDIWGDIPSYVSSAIFSITGMLSICTAINQTYRAFISTRSILLANKVGENIFKSIIYFLSYFLFQGIDFWIRKGLTISLDSRILSFFMQGCAGFYLFLSVLQILFLLYKILKLLLTEDPSLLDQLYTCVHNGTRKITDELNNANYASLDACIDYLCTKAFDNKQENTLKNFDSQKIQSRFFLDEYEMLPKHLRVYTFCASSLILTLLNTMPFLLVFRLMLYQPVSSCVIGASMCIVIDIVGLAIIFSRKKGFHKLFIRSAIGSWGFEIHDSEKPLYFSAYHRFGTTTKNSVQYQKSLRQLYCLISLFRDCLSAGYEIAEHCLQRIAQQIEQFQCGYTLFAVCVHLFCLKYPAQKKDELIQLHNLLDSSTLNKSTIAYNTSELAKDILHDGRPHNCTYLFSNNSKLVATTCSGKHFPIWIK